MDRYTLIDIDKMEASVVRRYLHQRNKADEQPIVPLVAILEQGGWLPNVSIREPRWETNVYPLYYYWVHYHKATHKEVYELVLGSLASSIAFDLQKHVTRAADTEIDILVEDVEYFVFIEAKVPGEGQKVKFEKTGGVHQLVRQYVQGRILERCITKTFALATIGANNAKPISLHLNEREEALLRAVGENRQSLEIPDLSWSLLSPSRRAAGVM